ncbi:MAG: hypothetical protein ACXVBE_05950 [Bdellovibrionota bacterium]
MKRFALLIALVLSPNAFADRILNPGEIYTSQYAGERLACDIGGNAVPDHYDYMTRDRVDHDDAWQNHSEGNAHSMCEGDGQAAVFFSSTVQKLIRDANAQCLQTYPRCAQLGVTQGEFIGKDRNHGRYGCFLRVTVRGTR